MSRHQYISVPYNIGYREAKKVIVDLAKELGTDYFIRFYWIGDSLRFSFVVRLNDKEYEIDGTAHVFALTIDVAALVPEVFDSKMPEIKEKISKRLSEMTSCLPNSVLK